MSLAVFDTLRNLKIKYKVLIIFLVLLLLMIELGALNISAVSDIRNDTERIANELIPRLIETTAIKDNLNLSILAAYDYVQTGNQASKVEYKEKLGQALVAQIQLFYLSQSEADFEFTTSFQDHINGINTALEDLVRSYENGAQAETIQKKLTAVATSRDAFASFLEQEIETKIQQQSADERQQTDANVQQTIINVSIVGVIALITLIALYGFVHRAVTVPIQQLTTTAERIGQGSFEQVEIESGDELGLFAQTFNTMTEKIQATQEELQIELEKTKKLDRQKTEFLSIAAHQLRTPMSGIKWVVSMAVEGDLGDLPKEAKEQLGKGLENVNRMITLINSLLDVTQIETQEFHYQFAETDIEQLVREAVIALEHPSIQAGISLKMESPTDTIAKIAVDPGKLKMALHNLIDNAIKYTPKDGSVTVSLSQDNENVRIHVKDTGFGIPPSEYERIYTKFFRGSNIQTIQADGSGLGLFIVHEIVTRHHGTVSFVSKIDHGTTFTIALPKQTTPTIS
jgi:signal transduction histidine kinase